MSRSGFFLIPFLLLLSLSCSDNDQVADPEEVPGVLAGRVIDSEDPSVGLAGATVRLDGTDRVAVTDEDGYYRFEDLEGGDFMVLVEPGSGSSYQSNSVSVSVHPGETVDVDVTVLPGDAALSAIMIYPLEARAGVLESVRFYAGGAVPGENGPDVSGYEIGFRPTWTIRSEKPIGVISREGIFIGTTTGSGEIVASFSDELQAVAKIDVVADDEVVRLFLSPLRVFRIEAGASRYLAAWAVNGAGDVETSAGLVWNVVPADIGTIEPAEGLSAEERAEVLEWLMTEAWTDRAPDMPGGGGMDDTVHSDGGPTLPDDPDESVPPVGPPPDRETPVDLEAVSLVLFTAAADLSPDALGSITVQAEGTNWKSFIDVEVYARGVLTDGSLSPGEASLPVDDGLFFLARGLNEWDRSMAGLEYEWEVTPPSIGTVEKIELYMGGPGGDDPTEPGDDPMPPPPDSGWGGPVQGTGSGALFTAGAVGSGEISVTIHDPVSNVSITRIAPLTVEPPPLLESISIWPNPVEGEVGDSVFVEAVALNDKGDIDWSAKIDWTLTGSAGSFDLYDGDYFPDYDDSLDGRDGTVDPVPPDDVDPGERGGVSVGVFVPGNPGAEGTLRAEAVSPGGRSVSAEVTVRTIGKGR